MYGRNKSLPEAKLSRKVLYVSRSNLEKPAYPCCILVSSELQRGILDALYHTVHDSYNGAEHRVPFFNSFYSFLKDFMHTPTFELPNLAINFRGPWRSAPRRHIPCIPSSANWNFCAIHVMGSNLLCLWTKFCPIGTVGKTCFMYIQAPEWVECRSKCRVYVKEQSVRTQHPAYLVNPRRACAARVTVVGFVCLFVCYSIAHSSNVCSSHKRYDLLNGQRRSEISNSFF